MEIVQENIMEVVHYLIEKYLYPPTIYVASYIKRARKNRARANEVILNRICSMKMYRINVVLSVQENSDRTNSQLVTEHGNIQYAVVRILKTKVPS